MGVHDADYIKVRELIGALDDEPLFIIRGQDIFAVPAIARYELLAIDAECEQSFVNNLGEVMGQFSQWQTDNAESVKKPD